MYPEEIRKLVRLVEPFLEFFDFVGWGKEEPRRYYETEDVFSWMTGLNAVIATKKNGFPFLKGVKGSCQCTSLLDFLPDWPRFRHLEVIDIDLPYVSTTNILELNKILSKNKGGLKRVAISIYGTLNDECVGENPPYWPFDGLNVAVNLGPCTGLTHLSLSIADGCTPPPPRPAQGWPQKLWNIYNLKEILMVNTQRVEKLECFSVL